MTLAVTFLHLPSRYTFDKTLLPDPSDTLGAVHASGLTIAGNLHDADGIGTWEDSYAAIAGLMGEANRSKRIEFTMTNLTYAHAVEDLALAPLEKAGFDFWWIDW